MNLTQYNDLGRTIAANHKGIGHTDEEEHFFRTYLSPEPFAALYIEELLSALSQRIKWPALIWEAYSISYEDNGANNVRRRKHGAFLLLKNLSDEQDFAELETVHTAMEAMAEEIISYLRRYFHLVNTKRIDLGTRHRLEMSEITHEKVTVPQHKMAGARVDFIFYDEANSQMAYDESKWNNPLEQWP